MDRVPPRIKLKQFSAVQIVLATCLGGLALLAMSLRCPFAFKVVLALMSVALALAVLLLELQGAPFHTWAANAIRYWTRGRYYIWRRGLPANTIQARMALTSQPNFFQRAWRFTSPHIGVGVAVATALAGIFLLAQLCSFAFRFERAISAAFANITPFPTSTHQPMAMATGTPVPAAVLSPTATPQPLTTPAATTILLPHGPLQVITGWQCPTALPEQGINTHLYLSAPGKPAWVEVHTSYTNGEKSSVGFQVPKGQAAIAVTAPSFVSLSSTLVRGDTDLTVECRTAYWNQVRNDWTKDLAATWWFPRTSWPNGVRLWFFQLTLPQARDIRLNVMRGEQVLYTRDYALPAGSSKVLPDVSAQTKSTEPGSSYLLVSDSQFAVGATWH